MTDKKYKELQHKFDVVLEFYTLDKIAEKTGFGRITIYNWRKNHTPVEEIKLGKVDKIIALYDEIKAKI